MPFVLLVMGSVLLIAGVRNTQTQLYGLLRNDFTGPNNFIYWFIAILLIGALGYVPKLKPISDGFLILVILVLFLKKGNPATNTGGGFFEQFLKQVKTTETKASPLTSVTTSDGTVIRFPIDQNTINNTLGLGK